MKGVEMLTDHPQPHWSNQVCVLLHTAICIKLYSCQREISHESDESVCTSLMCRRMCSWKCVENERMKSRDSVILGCICITGISYLVISLCSMQVTFKHKIMTNCNKWTKTETSLCVLVLTLICWYFHWQKYVICSICKGIFLLYFYFTIAIFTKVVPFEARKESSLYIFLPTTNCIWKISSKTYKQLQNASLHIPAHVSRPPECVIASYADHSLGTCASLMYFWLMNTVIQNMDDLFFDCAHCVLYDLMLMVVWPLYMDHLYKQVKTVFSQN